jgi:hypothetical protein
MRRIRLAAAAVLLVLAAVLAVLAHDVLAWRSALNHGDAVLRTHPRQAVWQPATWVPGNPVAGTLALRGDLALRRAVRAYDIAATTGRGFDSGVTQSVVRGGAEVRLSDVAAQGSARDASQASDLLGVLVEAGGTVVGGVTADDRAQAAFTAAVQRDPSNFDAKYNLELLLRRTRATAARHGAGNGAGSRGRGRKGAGAGTPGRGY